MSYKNLEKDRPGKIFIGGLAEEIDEKNLEKEFSKYGRITEVLVIRDKVRQLSRGFGFVTYENPIDAEDAIKNMDGKEIQGKKLHVEDAVRGGTMSHDSSNRFGRDGGFNRDGFSRGRPGRGGPPRGRGGPLGRGGRGGFPPRDGPPRGGSGYGGRGGSFSRGSGRGGSLMSRFEGRSSSPPLRRDDSPPRKTPLMSRGPPSGGRNGFDSGRGRPMSGFDGRREDRYESSFSERGPPPRSRDPYPPSPPRDSGRGAGILDRYSYRDSYPSARDDRTESYSRGVSSRGDYMTTRNDPRDSPRDSYPPRSSGDGYASISSRDYREPVSSRGGDRFDSHRDFESGSSSMRFSREIDSRGMPRSDYDLHRESGPTSRGYGGSSSGGPSSGSRGPPPFSSSRPYPPSGSERRSSAGDRDGFNPGTRRPAGPPTSRGPPPAKRPRSDAPPSRGPPPSSFRR